MAIDESKLYQSIHTGPTIDAAVTTVTSKLIQASDVSASVHSVATKNTQAILTAHDTAILERYTKSQIDAMVGGSTNDLIKSVVYNPDDGTLTFTKKDGTKTVIDTDLEKVPAKFEFVEEGSTVWLVITNMDGSQSRADFSELAGKYEFSSTPEIAFSVTAVGTTKTISAALRDASVTFQKLSIDTVTKLEGYVLEAKNQSEAAQAAAETAVTSKDAAKQSELDADASALAAQEAQKEAEYSSGEAQLSAMNAAASESNSAASAKDAGLSATLAHSWAIGGTNTRDGEDVDNAKYYAQQSGTSAAEALASAQAAASAVNNVTAEAERALNAAALAVESAEAAKGSETAAATSAEAAALNAASAKGYAEAAALSATDANSAKTAAQSSAEASALSETAALASETAAAESAQTAKTEADRAKEEADRAALIVGDNYLTKDMKGAPGGVAELGEDGKVPASQLPDISVSTTVNATLTASAWSGTGPFTQSIAVAGMTADKNGTIGVATGATSEQRAAARNGMLSVTAQSAGSITVTADGDKPAVDIPVTIILLGGA